MSWQGFRRVEKPRKVGPALGARASFKRENRAPWVMSTLADAYSEQH